MSSVCMTSPSAPSRTAFEQARNRALAFPAALTGPASRLLAAVHRRLVAARARQTLEALPDRLLADVGLERADLPEVLRRDAL